MNNVEEILGDWVRFLWSIWAGPQMPTTKNIERQMVSVGDPISSGLSTLSHDSVLDPYLNDRKTMKLIKPQQAFEATEV